MFAIGLAPKSSEDLKGLKPAHHAQGLWLAISQGLLFRDCLCYPIRQWCLLPRLAHLATVSFWALEGCIKATEQVRGYFFLLFSRLVLFSITDTPVLINYEVCFARQFSALYRILFFFKGEIIVKLHGD